MAAGWELFKAGEISDSVYFVLAGSLGAFQAMPDGRSDCLGHIRAGEPVGEMALFEGAVDEDGDGLPDNVPHTSSVYALRDSEVLEISRKGFDRITKADPDILSSMIRVMLMRLREGRKPNRRNAPKVFALVATSPTIDLELRAEALQKALQRFNMNCRIIDEAEGRDKPTGYFDELEANYDIVMLVTSVGDSSWFRLSTRQADRVWVFGRADARPSNPLLPSHDSPASTLQLVDMILLHHSPQPPAPPPAAGPLARAPARFATSWLVADLEVGVSLARRAGPGVVVRERWDVPGVEAGVPPRPGSSGHIGAGGATPHSPHGIVPVR